MFIAIFATGGIVVGLLVHFKTFQFTFQFNFQSAAPELQSATTLGTSRTLSIASAASTMITTTATKTGIVNSRSRENCISFVNFMKPRPEIHLVFILTENICFHKKTLP